MGSWVALFKYLRNFWFSGFTRRRKGNRGVTEEVKTEVYQYNLAKADKVTT